MIASFPPLTPRTIGLILSDPTVLAEFIDLTEVQFVAKLIILFFLLLYIAFAIIFIVQTRRNEQWLMSLKKYRFSRWAVVHLVVAILGWILALIIL